MQIKTFHNRKRTGFYSNSKTLFYITSQAKRAGHVLMIQFWLNVNYMDALLAEWRTFLLGPEERNRLPAMGKVGQEIIKFFQTEAIASNERC